jgi:hypothetical protein
MSMRKSKRNKSTKIQFEKSVPQKGASNYSKSPSLRLDPEDVEIYNNQWKMYKALEKQIEEAWAKLRNDVKRRANPQTISRDKNHLLLLLGECNYMARECIRYTDTPGNRTAS